MDSSIVALGSASNVPPILSDQPSTLQISATVLTSAIASLTIINTFMPTTIASLIRINEPQTTSTAIEVGSSTSIVPMVIGSGGVAWNIPCQMSYGPVILPPFAVPIAQAGPSTSSATPGPPLVPAQGSTTSVSSSDLPGQGAPMTSQSQDFEWLTEAPLTTATKTTSPAFISSITTGINDDGNSEYSGHPVPAFWHPRCLVGILERPISICLPTRFS